MQSKFQSFFQAVSRIDKLYATDWIVYCKKPFEDPAHVIRYLGRYTHKAAISESRIVSYDPDTHAVRFKWKDYKDHNRLKITELSDVYCHLK